MLLAADFLPHKLLHIKQNHLVWESWIKSDMLSEDQKKILGVTNLNADTVLRS